MPFRWSRPLSRESSRNISSKGRAQPRPSYSAGFSAAAAALSLPPPPLSFCLAVFHPPAPPRSLLKFRHLISRVREDRVYPLYALRVSSTSSGNPRVPSFLLQTALVNFADAVEPRHRRETDRRRRPGRRRGTGGNMYFEASSVDRLVIVPTFPPVDHPAARAASSSSRVPVLPAGNAP